MEIDKAQIVKLKVDKVFMWVVLCSLLFGNMLYMWGKHIGINECEPFIINKIYKDTHNDKEIAVMQNQIEIIRIQLSQIKLDWGDR